MRGCGSGVGIEHDCGPLEPARECGYARRPPPARLDLCAQRLVRPGAGEGTASSRHTSGNGMWPTLSRQARSCSGACRAAAPSALLEAFSSRPRPPHEGSAADGLEAPPTAGLRLQKLSARPARCGWPARCRGSRIRCPLPPARPQARDRPYRLDQLDRLILGPPAPATQGRASVSATLKNPAENPAKTDPCQGRALKVAATLS